jgi:ribosomal protein S18 acetylase RimI-like enzyme
LGIGKILVQKELDTAKELAIDRIELHVWLQNNSALKFYKKLGFQTYNQKMALII